MPKTIIPKTDKNAPEEPMNPIMPWVPERVFELIKRRLLPPQADGCIEFKSRSRNVKMLQINYKNTFYNVNRILYEHYVRVNCPTEQDQVLLPDEHVYRICGNTVCVNPEHQVPIHSRLDYQQKQIALGRLLGVTLLEHRIAYYREQKVPFPAGVPEVDPPSSDRQSTRSEDVSLALVRPS